MSNGMESEDTHATTDKRNTGRSSTKFFPPLSLLEA